MRWIWIDRVEELAPGERCRAVKSVSLGEDVLHDHFAADGDQAPAPVMPPTLLIEGMAQTAGILVGSARGYRERVILAKITRASFEEAVGPGVLVEHDAALEQIDDTGAAANGTVRVRDGGGTRDIGEIKLVFSHLDAQRTAEDVPEHNFVFTEMFMQLLRRSGVPMPGEG